MNKIESGVSPVFFHRTAQGLSFRRMGAMIPEDAIAMHPVPNTANLISPQNTLPEKRDVELIIEASQTTIRAHLPEE